MIPNDDTDAGAEPQNEVTQIETADVPVAEGTVPVAYDDETVPEPAPEPKAAATAEGEGTKEDESLDEDDTDVELSDADEGTEDDFVDGPVPLADLHPIEVVRRLSNGSMSRPDGQAWLDANKEKIEAAGY